MTIAVLFSLILGLFGGDDNQETASVNSSAKIVITKPIITDDTGG